MRFQKAFKNLETILENKFQLEPEKIDKVLDQIPEYHAHIEIKPLVVRPETKMSRNNFMSVMGQR